MNQQARKRNEAWVQTKPNQRSEQIKQVKNMIVQASRATEVEDILRHKYGYEVINGLKIREYNEDE